MPRMLMTAIVLTACAALGPAGTQAEPGVPEARRVIVRGHKDLAAAIAAAAGGSAAAEAALVLDATPHTRLALGTLRVALSKLAARTDVPKRWRIARLGSTVSPAVTDPGALGRLLPVLLRNDTAEPSTIGALRRTVKSFEPTDGVVIYLADWRFEDEHDVEALITLLARKRLRFGVVGSEAAFGHAWNDGVADVRDRMGALQGGEDRRYDPGIGRRPFGPFDKATPWHGGDSAAPHLPYRFARDLWVTEFRASDLAFAQDATRSARLQDGKPNGMEDLLERMGRQNLGVSAFRRFPLPSSFGPHGLMRTAAVRGGRYVLWSWNPERRASIRYDSSRCDAFGPDLRSRATLRRALPQRPVAAAMQRAWARLTERRNAVVLHTPPLAGGPASIDLVDSEHARLQTVWMNRSDHRQFLDRVRAWRTAVTEAQRTVERGLQKADTDTGPAAARLRADADLFHTILGVLQFELSEALAVASAVPRTAFDDPDSHPAIRRRTWIERGDDPDAIRTTDADLQDPEAGEAVKRARATHLRRYRGTPFGLQVAGNTVDTWQRTKVRRMEPSKGSLPGRTPAESGGDTPKTPTTPPSRPPGGGSGGGGPSTGGR